MNDTELELILDLGEYNKYMEQKNLKSSLESYKKFEKYEGIFMLFQTILEDVPIYGELIDKIKKGIYNSRLTSEEAYRILKFGDTLKEIDKETAEKYYRENGYELNDCIIKYNAVKRCTLKDFHFCSTSMWSIMTPLSLALEHREAERLFKI